MSTKGARFLGTPQNTPKIYFRCAAITHLEDKYSAPLRVLQMVSTGWGKLGHYRYTKVTIVNMLRLPQSGAFSFTLDWIQNLAHIFLEIHTQDFSGHLKVNKGDTSAYFLTLIHLRKSRNDLTPGGLFVLYLLSNSSKFHESWWFFTKFIWD